MVESVVLIRMVQEEVQSHKTHIEEQMEWTEEPSSARRSMRWIGCRLPKGSESGTDSVEEKSCTTAPGDG